MSGKEGREAGRKKGRHEGLLYRTYGHRSLLRPVFVRYRTELVLVILLARGVRYGTVPCRLPNVDRTSTRYGTVHFSFIVSLYVSDLPNVTISTVQYCSASTRIFIRQSLYSTRTRTARIVLYVYEYRTSTRSDLGYIVRDRQYGIVSERRTDGRTNEDRVCPLPKRK